MRARRVTLLALLLASCTSMQEQYNVRRSNVSCDDANRYAFQSMSSLGYTVTDLRRAAVGQEGLLKGTRSGERGDQHSATVHIRCDPGEVFLSAAEDQFLKQDMTFSRGFYLSFTSLADQGPAVASWERERSGGTTSGGVKFKITPQIGLESKLDFGEDLAGAGILAVKVIVDNGSGQTYQFDPQAIELRPAEGGGRVTQIPTGEAAAALARASSGDAGQGAPPPDPHRLEALLRERALKGGTLRPGDHAEGFVYFPTGKYARARATLVDTATSEGEGFAVEFE
jgi:hypothetical protein